MNIVFVTQDPFPIGMAATRRIYFLAKSFTMEKENSVTVLSSRVPPKEFQKQYDTWKGQLDGIDYEFTTRTIRRANSFLIRRIIEIFGIINLFYILIRKKTNENIDYLYLWETIQKVTLSRLLIILLCYLFNIPVIQEFNEKTWKSKEHLTFLEKMVSPLTGTKGAVCISNYLHEWVKRESSETDKKVKIIQIPILTDTQECIAKRNITSLSQDKYFMLSIAPQYKNEIMLIFDAISNVWNKYPDVKLIISGFNLETTGASWLIDFLACEKNLSKKIVLAGYLDQRDLYKYYSEALALLTPLLDNVASTARFPTKLAEYLISGQPIIACNIGEIEKYLKHKVNALLVDPVSSIEFAKQMLFVIENPIESMQIGAQGRLVAEQSFDYRTHSEKLVNFLKSIG